MREIEAVEVQGAIGQAQTWLLEQRPEYFSRLAGMHPERRITLARTFQLLGEDAGRLRFAIDGELRTFQELDGQMTQSFSDLREVVTLELEPAGEGVFEVSATVTAEKTIEDELIAWTERLQESLRRACETVPADQEQS